MRSVAEIIEALGDTGAVAGALGLSPSTVSSWKARGSIPGEHWLDIEGLARAAGFDAITIAGLASLHARSRDVAEAPP